MPGPKVAAGATLATAALHMVREGAAGEEGHQPALFQPLHHQLLSVTEDVCGPELHHGLDGGQHGVGEVQRYGLVGVEAEDFYQGWSRGFGLGLPLRVLWCGVWAQVVAHDVLRSRDHVRLSFGRRFVIYLFERVETWWYRE